MLSASGRLRPPPEAEDPEDQGLCPRTPLGALPQTPVIGSRSALAINVSTCAVQNFP